MSQFRSAVANTLLFFLALSSASAVLAQAPTGNVTISANTTWPSASYNVTSLTVQSGAVLTIGGGSTVSVTGGVTVTGNSSIVLQAVNNTVQVNGAWAGAGVVVQAGSVQVDANSTINADGQGYVSNAGPGGGVGGGGGNYGGYGGYSPGTLYGSAAMPVDLGSGGGSGQYGGSNGGGALRLIVSGTLTNNGVISANGQAVQPSAGAAGAGGSVYVTTGMLAGSGSFAANGGSNTSPATLGGGVAGGGGRVAIYYAAPASFTGFTTSMASGGVFSGDSTRSGGNGTAVFFDTSVTNSNVSVYESGFLLPANATVQYNSLTITGGASVVIGSGSTVTIATGLSVSGASAVTVGGGSTVTVGGAMLVTGKSSIVLQSVNTSALVNGAWAGVGVTLQSASLQVDSGSAVNADGQGYISNAGPGGGVGGGGGNYGGYGGYSPGTLYGSASMPVDLGSGGGSGQYGGANGGGAIRLIVSGTLTNNGVISANGQAVQPSAGAAGSGGSVYVTTATLAGSGSFTANGGSNTTPTLSGGAAGGGGRVAIYYAGPTTFTGFAPSTASGGVYTGTASTASAGANGTAVFFDTSATNSNVSVYQAYVIPANTTVQYNSLTVASGASFTIGGGSQVTLTQALRVTGVVTALSTNNTGLLLNRWAGKGILIAAGSVQIDATGSINADTQGYLGAEGPGAGIGGGSYGGAGGGQSATTTYGSKTAPVDLGSGGAYNLQNYYGGSGGGAIELLVAGTLTNNGSISANGSSSPIAGYGDAGAGGSVYVQTNTLQGSGTISTNGGSDILANTNGAGGGGGRISVNYVVNSGVVPSALSANGGAGATPGSAGTINFIQTPGLQFLQPSLSVVHGVVPLQWFSDTGLSTSLTVSGPQTATFPSSGLGLQSATWDTTAIPDGAYELRLAVVDVSGITTTVSRNVVVNNSVKWFSGVLTANTHWTAGNVYALGGDLIVPAGITLTIDPGSIVKALPGFQILVQSGGTLTALGGGTATPVIFTTFDDASVGGNTDFNQGVSEPQPGEWGGVTVQAGGTFNSNSTTVIDYARSGLNAVISTNTTLLPTEAYEISGTLTVQSGATLTLQPGTILKMDSGAGIQVNAGGSLIANGTLAQPIYITSINDNSIGTNLTGATTPPAPGDWNSINIVGATASLKFVHMLYGGGPIPTVAQEGMFESTGAATISISDSILAYSYYIGIQTGLTGAGDVYTITDTTFYGNQDRTINVYNGSTVHVINSTFDSNAAGIANHGGGIIDVENTVVTGFTNATYGGISGVTALKNNDVFSSVAGIPNYTGGTDPTGTSGNISVNPVYMNGPQHDYRPTYGSPLIDAANGTVANYPVTDAYNDARYNDPLVSTKTGVADASGNYPDIGAFEFLQSAPSDLDLAVSDVQGPASVIVGTQVQVNWTITNVGSGTVYGPWHDAIYLVADPGTSPVETLAGQVLEGQNVVLGPGATYSATGRITVPGTVVGDHNWEVKTNVLGEVFEGANTANNTALSLDPVQVDLTALTTGAGPLSSTLAGTGQSAYFKITPGATQTTRIQVALTSGTGSVQIFVGGGYVPTPQHYDYQQVEFDSVSASVVIPSGSGQTFYIAAYGQALPAGGSPFTIQASVVQFSLVSVSPGSVPNNGPSTITFLGGGFTSSTTFQLVGGGKTYNPTAVFLSDADHAEATFAVASIPMGTYTAQATNGTAVTLPGAVSVVLGVGVPFSAQGFGYDVQVSLEAPAAFRKGFPATVNLNYTNISGNDIPSPLLYISAVNGTVSEIPTQCAECSSNFETQFQSSYNSGLVLGINRQGPAGILPAGGSGTIQFVVTPTGTASVSLSASSAGSELVAMQPAIQFESFEQCGPGLPNCLPLILQTTGAYSNAQAFCNSLVSTGGNALATMRACLLLLNNAGFNYATVTSYTVVDGVVAGAPYVNGHLSFAGFNEVLAADATALSASGDYEFDAQKLLGYELTKDGLNDFTTRYHQGAFGYGPSHPFDITLSTSAGVSTVSYPDGSARVFATPSPTQANVSLGVVGDYGTLALQPDASYLLTEANGVLYHFIPVASTSVLDYIQDRAGNRVNLTYTNNLVTGVADAFGNNASMQYDALGHITSQTDPEGRVTTFAYTTLSDAYKSTFLTSVTDSSGTTAITWNEGGSHGVGYLDDTCVTTYCEPAIGISSVAFPDGTHVYYTYDLAGRITGSTRDGGATPIVYTYNSDGSVITTDALGKSIRATPSVGSLPSSITDQLGNVSRYRFDSENKLIAGLGAVGDSGAFGYDQSGDLSSITTATGSVTNLAYIAAQGPSSLTDPNGNVTTMTYDSDLNGIASTYANGEKVTFTYDSMGRMLTRTNRRGNTVTFTYAPHGELASKTFSNGSQVLFAYDTHFNLQSVTTSAGATRYTYDGADRLSSVVNPDGTSLAYTYNANGQRSSMKDSSGFQTNYNYDALGRFSELTSGTSALIVGYTYDAAGNLLTKAFGNGTTTSFTYDATGNVLSVIHSSPSHTILSEYDYTYDAAGYPITAKTPSGSLTYTNDLDGQLIAVNTPAGNLAYNYDLSGNRTSVASNGAPTTYLANNLNEYTSINGANYLYDADGNLTSGNGWTYTYNDENKLVTMVNATDSWSFQYDGLNNRVATVHNGKQTRFLIDPVDFGNLTAEIDQTGAVIAHYTYGIDLTSSVQASGTTGYYHFDATGNTTQITSATGAIVNSYAYLPFGEQSVLAASLPNPFTFSGELGVRNEGTGIYFTRNRAYNPQLGRFQQLDPTGPAGGQNLYEYGQNAPLHFIDPSGLDGIVPRVPGSTPTPLNTRPTQPNPDPVQTFGNTTAGHVLNALGGELPTGVAGFTVGTSSNVVTIDSLAHNVNSHNTAGIIHDSTLGLCRQISFALPKLRTPGPLGVLEDVIKHIGLIDEGSQLIFNGWFIPDDPIPDGIPVTKIPGLCGGCIFKPGPTNKVPTDGSVDPNAKLTSGFGTSGFIPTGVPIVYTIYYENQPTATAPAQKVTVTDTLAANLDWSTVQLSQIAFNGVTLNLAPDTQTYSARANVSTDANPVAVSAALNPATGVLTWTMQSVDPITLGVPANPLAGFLPPNNAANSGIGSVTFSVMPKAGLSNAVAVTNQASIVFDANAAILTNTVTNTIDSSSPTSSINSMPGTSNKPAFTVSWSGTDPNGSGIASYNIYVSTDGGTYSLWLSATALNTATFTGNAGHTYTFYSLATNNVGLIQTVAGTPQTIAVSLVVPVVTVTPAASTITPLQSVSVNIVVSSTSTPTGTVTLSSGSYISAAATLVSGIATIVVPAAMLASGPNTFTATYTPDASGSALFSTATGSATVTVLAGTVQVAVGTFPAGPSFSVDGTTYTTAQTFAWTVGSLHTLATSSPQTASGVQETFSSWSDAGAIAHSVTAASGTASYTATFNAAYLLTLGANPAVGGAITPATGTYYPAGTVVGLTATPAAGYSFTNWTGAVASSSSVSTTITMNAAQTVTGNFSLIPVPVISLTPSSLTFTTTVGLSSAAQTVKLLNTGTGVLNIAGFAISGSGASSFSQTNTCGTSVAAGGSCTIFVLFAPTSAASFSATLTVSGNSTIAPTISLAGTGMAVPTFTIAASPASQATTSGGSAIYLINVSPQGGAFTNAITLTATATGLPSGTAYTFAPASVTPGSATATSTLTVQVPSIVGSNRRMNLSATAPVFALLGCVLLVTRKRRQWLTSITLALALLCALLPALAGCASQRSFDGTITITASSGVQVQTTSLTLTVN